MIHLLLRKLFRPAVRESEVWKVRLALKASEFDLGHAAEVIELQSRIEWLVAEKQDDHLSYLLTQVDPYQRVFRTAEGVVVHRESDFEPYVLHPCTVLNWHFPQFKEDLARIVVHGSTVHFFVDGEVAARFEAIHPVPMALSIERDPTILHLISEYTGLLLPWEEQIRMEKAIFTRVGSRWFFEINRSIAFAFK